MLTDIHPTGARKPGTTGIISPSLSKPMSSQLRIVLVHVSCLIGVWKQFSFLVILAPLAEI